MASIAHDDGSLAGLTITLQAAWHPGLARLLSQSGAQVGRIGARVPVSALRATLSALAPGSLVPAERVRLAQQRRALTAAERAALTAELRASLTLVPGALEALRGLDLGRRLRTRTDGGVIALDTSDGTLRLRAGLLSPLAHGPDELSLGGLARGSLTSVILSLPEALSWMEAAADAALTVVDASNGAIGAAIRRLDRSVVLTGVHGAPGLALVVTGRTSADRRIAPAADALADLSDRSRHSDHCDHSDMSSRTASTAALPHLEIAPAVADVAAMDASAATGRAGLHGYQDHFVSCYLATDFGVVNALAPGLGKTVCAASALRERGPATRALIVVPAPLREQWRDELAVHHPAARTVVLTSATELPTAERALDDTDGPVCVVVSFDLARAHVERLAAWTWTDLVVDEAAFLKSRRSARVRALWRLRACAQRAMVLTGTPCDRSIDELGPLVAFSRNDPHLFDGAALSRRARTLRLSQVLGPTVFRATTQDAGLPSVRWEVIPVELSGPELALVHEALDQLRAAVADYESGIGHRLAAMGRVLRALDAVRAAACDPAATTGSLAHAAALDAVPGAWGGMLDAAAPAKRSFVAQIVADHVASGRAALVACDFLRAAPALAAELAAHSVRVATISSRQSVATRRARLAAFDAGEIDALILSGLARQGLNLQRADLVVHYDLPLSAAALTQRVGRALRLGTTATAVRSVVPVALGTLDEILVELVRDAQARATDWLEAIGGADTSRSALALALAVCRATTPGTSLDLDGLAR